MGRADYYAPGDWNGTCYECGRKFKASTMLRHWQGYWVCQQHWEPRQAQDFVRSINDVQTAPWQQPVSTIIGTMCTPNGCSAVPGYAMPGCATPGYLSPFFNVLGDPL